MTWIMYNRGPVAGSYPRLYGADCRPVRLELRSCRHADARFYLGGRRTHGLNLSTRAETIYRYLALASEQIVQDAGVFFALMLLALAPLVSPKLRMAILAVGFCAALVNRLYSWNSARPLWTQLWVNSMAVTSPLVFMGFAGLAPGVAEHLRHQHSAMTGGTSQSRFVSLFITSLFLLVLATSPLLSAIGLNFGPRILMPVYPALALWGVAALSRWISEKNLLRLPALAFAVLLIGVGFVDSAVYLHRLRLKADLSASLMKLIEKAAPLPVITDVRWLATEMSPIYYSRPFIGIIPRRASPLPPDHARKAADVARRLHAQEALVITYRDIPPELLAQATVEPAPDAADIHFPDGSFRVEINKLRWK